MMHGLGMSSSGLGMSPAGLGMDRGIGILASTNSLGAINDSVEQPLTESLSARAYFSTETRRVADEAEDEDGDGDHDDEDLGSEENEDGEPRKRLKTTRKMSEQQRIERREKNREHAKRSRVRKKIIMESMQDKVRLLYAANQRLKDVIRAYLPPEEYLELLGNNDSDEEDGEDEGEVYGEGDEEGDGEGDGDVDGASYDEEAVVRSEFSRGRS